MTETDERRKAKAAAWFESLRDRLCAAFEAIEDDYAGPALDIPPGRFSRRSWAHEGGGGGVSAILRGRVFEKVGVNVSTVWGVFADDFRGRIPGTEASGAYWASGISLVAHMRSPKVPAAHMNTRYIVTGAAWFGGGADLTPSLPERGVNDREAADFHAALKACCDAHPPADYARFKQWADDYFFLPHRGEPRGAGGIFYDNLASGDWEADFAFTRAVGETFLDIFPRLVRRRMNEPFTPAEREAQLVRRGRYVEFNLLYDRGTRFGLETGGDVEAILMSLPPTVRWP